MPMTKERLTPELIGDTLEIIVDAILHVAHVPHSDKLAEKLGDLLQTLIEHIWPDESPTPTPAPLPAKRAEIPAPQEPTETPPCQE
jgi:hypothetical protein